jgi:hypothetical protein
MQIPNAPAVTEMSEALATVPEAVYNLRIQKAEYVAVPKGKDAKGPYIKVSTVITGPGDTPHLGRYVFQNYSLTGDGSFRLREMLEVTGHPAEFRITDTDELIGLEFGAAVIIQKGTQGYSDKNEIRKALALV